MRGKWKKGKDNNKNVLTVWIKRKESSACISEKRRKDSVYTENGIEYNCVLRKERPMAEKKEGQVENTEISLLISATTTKERVDLGNSCSSTNLFYDLFRVGKWVSAKKHQTEQLVMNFNLKFNFNSNSYSILFNDRPWEGGEKKVWPKSIGYYLHLFMYW